MDRLPGLGQAAPEDWTTFLALAGLEGWRIPQIELRLFAGPWAGRILALRGSAGFAGLVTAVAHERSGWIGNLLVPSVQRGRGYGRRLFQAARERLLEQGCSRLWLTASPQGQPLYAASGFRPVELVERWVRPPGSSGPVDAGPDVDPAVLARLDRAAWGEARRELLDGLVRHGQVFSCGESAALLQTGAELQVLGPWLSEDFCPGTNRRLLKALLAAADPQVEIVCDVLASSPLRSLLVANGFSRAGSTRLMVSGEPPDTGLRRVVALASLGSLG